MVNINPDTHSEFSAHHTHYLRFDEKHQYVQSFWEGNPDMDRCWVPWSWCKSEKVQSENNSIVIFAPANDTLHGVKANYNHLTNQRTQLYGNFWYHNVELESKPVWEDLQIHAATKRDDDSRTISDRALAFLSKVFGAPRRHYQVQNVISNRLKSS
jgi:hypothetical protein